MRMFNPTPRNFMLFGVLLFGAGLIGLLIGFSDFSRFAMGFGLLSAIIGFFKRFGGSQQP
jgi:hypothetical protein